jgi:hypothetical protein
MSSRRAAAFFSASGAALSREAADSKINDQSACSLNTVYKRFCTYFAKYLPEQKLFLTNPV